MTPPSDRRLMWDTRSRARATHNWPPRTRASCTVFQRGHADMRLACRGARANENGLGWPSVCACISMRQQARHRQQALRLHATLQAVSPALETVPRARARSRRSGRARPPRPPRPRRTLASAPLTGGKSPARFFLLYLRCSAELFIGENRESKR